MSFTERWCRILTELQDVFEYTDTTQVERLQQAILEARRVLLTGQGRSGLVARALAMRLVHLGLTAHVVGEATAPAIGPGDLLLALSGSGKTPTTLHQAQRAHDAGARVAVISAGATSPLVELADVQVRLPIGPPDSVISQQFGGSLFEQAALLLADGLVAGLQQKLSLSDSEMMGRHSNLE